MFLKFVDRTWILLRKLIERGEKEGQIKHIEIPLNEWNMLVSEWRDLNPNIQQTYLKRFKVIDKNDIPTIPADFIMDEDFVDKWVAEEYAVYYSDVKLILKTPDWEAEQQNKAEADTELNTDKD